MFRALVLSAALLALLCAPAQAAAPNAVNDTLTAAPTGVLDALGNDSDADGDALSVTSTTAPANGTVTCSALGACFYQANPGFTGSDSFTYTVSAGGEQDTATVNVTVSAATVTQAIAAADDEAATLAGQAVTFNILANDRGQAPLEVQSNTSPVSGTVSCSSAGVCQYQPNAGFSGRDGFVYVLEDGGGQTRSAMVRIAVARADATFNVGAGGSPATVAPGGRASWFASVTPSPADLASDELRALALPSLSTLLSGPHGFEGGSERTAAGWSVASVGSDGSVTANATTGALLGNALSQTFPKPLPPISQGSGGDGHDPILVGSKVFAFFHHQHPTQATCLDRATGALCPGYPKQLTVGASDINGPAVVSGTKIWWHALMRTSYTQTVPIGLFCWDAATDASCGVTFVERVNGTSDRAASHPVLAGGKMWFAADTGKLYCLEPATGAPCATPFVTTGLTGGNDCLFSYPSTESCMDAVTHGTRVFVSLSGAAVACIDVSALATCPGWDTPKAFGGDWNLWNKYDASGQAIGVCVLDLGGGSGECVDDASPGSSTSITNFPDADGLPYHATQEAETGTRTLSAQLSRGGLGCYDWTTMAPCTGGDYEAGGWIDQDENGAGLPSAYGATFDGACVIALGDPGRVFTVDPAGTSPCTSLRSGSGTNAIDLRSQRCDGTVGAARWQDVKLTDSGAAELDALTVIVRDAATGAVLASGDLVTGGTLDISGIDPAAHPSIIVDASVAAKDGTDPWADGIPPRIVVGWVADPQYVCFSTIGSDSCADSDSTPISMLARLASPAREATAGLTLLRNRCAAAAAAPAAAASAPAAAKPARRCSGLRRFRIRIRFPGRRVRNVTVLANGKPMEVTRFLPRPHAIVDLRGRPRQRIVVRIRIRTKTGGKVVGKRVYHACTPKRKGRGFRL